MLLLLCLRYSAHSTDPLLYGPPCRGTRPIDNYSRSIASPRCRDDPSVSYTTIVAAITGSLNIPALIIWIFLLCAFSSGVPRIRTRLDTLYYLTDRARLKNTVIEDVAIRSWPLAWADGHVRRRR